jgi:hypothetical protein
MSKRARYDDPIGDVLDADAEKKIAKHATKCTIEKDADFHAAMKKMEKMIWSAKGLGDWRLVVKVPVKFMCFVQSEVILRANATYYDRATDSLNSVRIPLDHYYLFCLFTGHHHHLNVLTAPAAAIYFAARQKERAAWLISDDCPRPLMIWIAWDRQTDLIAGLQMMVAEQVAPRDQAAFGQKLDMLDGDITTTFTAIGKTKRGADWDDWDWFL